MEPAEIARLLRKGWFFLVLGCLLGASIGALAAARAAPEYTASTRQFVSVQTPQTATAVDVSQGNAAAQQKVRSYTDLITSASVLRPVIDDLDLDTSVGALARRVDATTPTNTVIIIIDVVSSSPTQAAKVANAVAESFSKVVEQLETPSPGSPSFVRVTTVQPATTPSSPSAPNRSLNVAIGALSGLLVGLGAATLRARLDTRVHSVRDVELVTDAPVLGTIGLDPNVKKRPLVVMSDPRNPLAEAYRGLRTNLQFVDLTSDKGSFVVTSAMPSEGKTTTTANLGIALAEAGAKVVVIEADLRRPRLAKLMGIEGSAGLTDLLIGRAELEDVLQPWGRTKLEVLTAGLVPPNPSELLGSDAMRALLTLLEQDFDYVLLDAPPLLPVTDAAVLAKLTSGALVVAAARRSRSLQLRSALGTLHRVGARVHGVIITMHAARGSSRYGSYGSYYGSEEPVAADDHPKPIGRRQRVTESDEPRIQPARPGDTTSR